MDKEIKELKQKIAKLEKEVSDLKNILFKVVKLTARTNRDLREQPGYFDTDDITF